MKLLPYRKLTLITSLTKQEVYNSIANNTAPFPNGQMPFYGKINSSDFTISRKIAGKNSFPLTIKGVIETDGNRRSVQLSFSPKPFIVIIAIVWLILAPFGAIMLLWKSASAGTFNPSALIPVVFLIFGFVVFRHAFGAEFDTCKYTLKDILEADEIIEN